MISNTLERLLYSYAEYEIVLHRIRLSSSNVNTKNYLCLGKRDKTSKLFTICKYDSSQSTCSSRMKMGQETGMEQKLFGFRAPDKCKIFSLYSYIEKNRFIRKILAE